jgi:hypothetical protein
LFVTHGREQDGGAGWSERPIANPDEASTVEPGRKRRKLSWLLQTLSSLRNNRHAFFAPQPAQLYKNIGRKLKPGSASMSHTKKLSRSDK